MMDNMPQEIEVKYILPAIRKEFARIMVRENKLSQKEAAKILNLTEAAVSQYLNDKRGSEVLFSNEIVDEIRKSVSKVIQHKSRSVLIGELYRVCNLTTVRHIICDIHRAQSKELEGCNVCFEIENATTNV